MNRQPDTWMRVVQFRATARCQPASRRLVPAGLIGPGLVMAHTLEEQRRPDQAI